MRSLKSTYVILESSSSSLTFNVMRAQTISARTPITALRQCKTVTMTQNVLSTVSPIYNILLSHTLFPQINLYGLIPRFPPSSPTSSPLHLQLPASRKPIISVPSSRSLHMPKPPEPPCPHHLT